MSKQPEPLRLAALLRSRNGSPTGFGLGPVCDAAADELCLLHEEVVWLKNTVNAELDCNMALRAKGGARLSEDMMTFSERVIDERDALLAAAKGVLAYFASGNSVPVAQATIKADSDAVAALRAAVAKTEAGEVIRVRRSPATFTEVTTNE